ncbi:PspC domain-containing protein [Foetidibacter luteolus]|uniref:PspC domain-containing protein n=1 Tax=Foetidibacter luteolus TaxID=2608880 RepID=UPI00129B544B|nr:PspC domain-containing protein [Foetidibacter luteolus]
MKKVININFQGRVIPIEEYAYDILKQYVESLRRYFANEEGRDEIINDIESRIAELFGETLKKGNTCITEDDVNAIIASMGRPEDFDDDEASVKSQLGGESTGSQFHNTESGAGQNTRYYRDENNKIIAGVCSGLANYFNIDPLVIRILFVIFSFGFGFGFLAYLVLWVAVPSTASRVIGSAKKRLLRDSENKIIAGVCSGLSHYFGVNPWIPRVLFLIPFMSFIFRWSHWGMFDFPHFLSITFSPGATLIYIILWLVLPEAKTVSEKLEMKGEKVDLNSIKKNVAEELKGVQERVTKFGKEAAETAEEKTRNMRSEMSGAARSASRGIGDVLTLLIKIFAYFIVAVVLLFLIGLLFFLGVGATGLMPLKPYLIREGTQSMLFWGTLILFIWVPIIGIITFIIRRIAKMKNNSQLIRYGFLALWIIGLFCFINLFISVTSDFKRHSTPTESSVYLSNPGAAKLELRAQPFGKYYSTGNWLRLEPFADIDEDTANVRNVQIRIIKSATDSFQVTMLKMANGRDRQAADELARKINYHIEQKDSVLLLDKGIAITPNEKFRNQMVYVTIAVPVGKRIEIDNKAGGWGRDAHFGWDDDWNWRDNYFENAFNWNHDVEYIMTNDGLKRVDGKDNDDQHNDDYNNKLDDYKKSREELERELEQKQQEFDEKKKEMEEMKKELEKQVDSTRYRYQPSTPDSVKKTTVQTVTPNTSGIGSIAPAQNLLARFAI